MIGRTPAAEVGGLEKREISHSFRSRPSANSEDSNTYPGIAGRRILWT